MLTISEVIAQVDSQDDPICGVVKDGPIYYLVLNDKEEEDFMFTDKTVSSLERALDIISEHKIGTPAIMVTISSAPRKWSTGFNIPEMIDAGIIASIDVAPRLWKCFSRIGCMPMTTVALINGHCFAGGAFFALVHDIRLMISNPRFKLCASEVNLGMELPNSALILCRTVLPA